MSILSRTDRRMNGIERVVGDEKPIATITGYVDGKSIGQKDDKVDGVLVLTPTRLVFYHQKLFGIGKHSSEEYPLHKINSINLDTGLMGGGTIRITGSGNDLKVKCGLTDQFPAEFVKKVKALMAGSGTNQIPFPVMGPVDVADQIKKLADLKDAGILTEEEFTAKKKQLLGI